MKILVLLILAVIGASLASALYYMVRDRGNSERMARALTVRVTLSILLFALLVIGYRLGLIEGKL